MRKKRMPLKNLTFLMAVFHFNVVHLSVNNGFNINVNVLVVLKKIILFFFFRLTNSVAIILCELQY